MPVHGGACAVRRYRSPLDNTTRRTVRYTVGWKITDADEQAIARLPEAAWETSLTQDGSLQDGYFVAELTGLNTREDWPEGMRLIVRRVRPSRRHLKKLTAFEKKTGWQYCNTATNIRRMWGVASSGHSQFLDVLHRSHAGVEDRVRTNKAMGLTNLPSASWEINRGWMLTANIAADLDAWVRLLALHDIGGLADAEPDAMRFRLYHLPARLADHARRRWLRIEATWPWEKRSPPAGSGSPPSRPSPDRPDTTPTRTRKEKTGSTPGPWNPAHPRRHATAHLEQPEDITGELPGRATTESR